MPRQRLGRRARPFIAGAAATAIAAGLTSWLVLGPNAANAGTISGTLYMRPDSAVVNWVKANPNDFRTPAIRDKIASQPQGVWFTTFNLNDIQTQTSTYVSAASNAGQIAQMVVYGIPNRDCGGFSSGGAPDVASYGTWIQNLSKGLGGKPVIIILETDALALQTCLSASEITARDGAIGTAVKTVKNADANAKVYLDGGHSAWNSAAEQASRLNAAGVHSADGFFTNVANFQFTANEVAYGKQILSVLNDAKLHQIIDTSRNGIGPKGTEWCDPTGRRIGPNPTVNTGEATVDAYLWIKPPGEADGCAGVPGTFLPDYAYDMAGGATFTPNPTTPAATVTPSKTTAPPTTAPATTAPATTAPATTAPATTAPATGCSVKYRVDSQWTTGFIGNVTITNGGPNAINGWALKYTFSGNQAITSLWSGSYTQSGAAVTVSNAAFNGTIPAGGSQNFGFQATFSGTNAMVTAFALNGAACTTS